MTLSSSSYPEPSATPFVLSQTRSEIHLHQLSNSPPPKTRHNQILHHLLDISQPTNLFVHKHQIHEDFVMIREDFVLFDFEDESTVGTKCV